MLRTRILTVLVLLPPFVAALFYASTTLWALLLMPLILLGAWEWGVLAGWRAVGRLMFVMGVAVAALLLWLLTQGDAAGARGINSAVYVASLLFWIIVAPIWLNRAWRVKNSWVMALSGIVLLLPLWLALVDLHESPWLMLILMAIVWVSDTAAYFCGKRWGRRKLAPGISPGKTWEGVWGALLGVGAYYFFLNASNAIGLAVLHGMLGLGVFLFFALLGIEGDLFESWIKRTAGVKDSGTAFPGHGGVLDRIDALTASMPAAALIVRSYV